MATHHLICLMLFTMNVLTNRLEVTIGLIFCCSLTDIALSIVRLLSETKFYKLGGIVAVTILIPSWIYFRLIAYPIYLYCLI